MAPTVGGILAQGRFAETPKVVSSGTFRITPPIDTLGVAACSFLARAGRPILEKPFVPAELRRLMTKPTGNN